MPEEKQPIKPAAPSNSNLSPSVSTGAVGKTTIDAAVGFEAAPLKPTPPVVSAKDAKIEEDVITSLKRAKRKDELSEEMGMNEGEAAEVPAALPRAIFIGVSRLIECPKFELTEKEAEVFAESLNEILKYAGIEVTNIVVHVAIVVSIIFIKAIQCRDAIARKTAGIGGPKQARQTWDEKRQAMVVKK